MYNEQQHNNCNKTDIFISLYKELKKHYGGDIREGEFLNYSNPIELLIAVILSARNTDKQVNKVTQDLFKKYKTIDDYLKAGENKFAKDISSIGLYKTKAKNIIKALQIIKEKYNGKVPDTIDELIKLPGVGRKTANVVLLHAYNKAEGIVVDTHVARFANRFGFSNSKSPEKIEKDLMDIVPKKYWKDMSFLIIRYGRDVGRVRSYNPDNDPIMQKYQELISKC